MLVKCPECGNKVSTLASACPQCGCPSSAFTDFEPQKPKKIYAHKRLPNGYGTIRKMADKRRKPYIAFAPVSITEYSDDGKPPKRKQLGSFGTYNEAYECLSFYHATHGRSTNGVPTFAEVFERYLDSLENDTTERRKSPSTIQGIKTHFRKCSSIHNKPMDMIYKEDMQTILDNLGQSYSATMGIKKLFNAVFKYAIENGIIEKNYASFVHVKMKRSYDSGEAFTEEQIKILWDNSDNKDVQTILILMYSGMRITELKVTQIDFEQGCFIGGIKTDVGRERIIPFHPSTKKFIEDFNQKEYDPKRWREKYFYPVLKKLDIEVSANGKKHTPHDTRHTFSWLADKYHMDELSKYLILGHQTGDVDKDVYGHRTLEELTLEMSKISTP